MTLAECQHAMDLAKSRQEGWIQGMTDAANLCDNYSKTNGGADAESLAIGAADCRDAIITARDAKKR
jgi:hypothetical protein